MTLKNATQNLWKAHCNFYDPRKAMNSVIDKIFNDHEAIIKAKDEEIERLKQQLSSVHNLMYRNGYSDAIDCYDTFGNFNTRHKPNAKARSIVAMLFWNAKREKAKAIKADVSMAYGIALSSKDMFDKAYAMLKDNK